MPADFSSGPITKKDLPLTFWCEDFAFGVCCKGYCHASPDFHVMRKRMITVYPESVYSVPYQDKMPDFSMGLSAEVCCGRYEMVRQLPREWWVRKYGEKHGYREEHIQILLNATKETYFRLSGEIASLYWIEAGRVGQDSPGRASSISRSPVRVSTGARRVSRTCIACGKDIGRNDDICDGCGEPQ